MSIINKRYESYMDFIDDLYRDDGQFNFIMQNDSYIFRGEGRNDYSLLPSALREYQDGTRCIAKYIPNVMLNDFVAPDEIDPEFLQHEAECELLRRFYVNTFNVGLGVPRVNFFAHDLGDELSEENEDYLAQGGKWLPDELKGIAALAQHYGIPTRLLDWTFNLNVALYFAAKSANHNINYRNSTKYMVIWALNYKNPDLYNRYNVELIKPLYSQNPNLNAQKGILLEWDEEKEENGSLKFVPLEQIFKESNSKDKNELIRFEISVKDSEKLYKYVDNNGYNTATIFPGFKDVADYTLEETILKDQPLF